MAATRLMPGAISLSICSHLPTIAPSTWLNPVRLPPGRGRPATKPWPTGSTDNREHDRDGAGLPLQRRRRRSSRPRGSRRVAARPAPSRTYVSDRRRHWSNVDRSAHCGHPPSPIAPIPGRNTARYDGSSGSFSDPRHQHADPPHAVALLRPRREWASDRAAAAAPIPAMSSPPSHVIPAANGCDSRTIAFYDNAYAKSFTDPVARRPQAARICVRGTGAKSGTCWSRISQALNELATRRAGPGFRKRSIRATLATPANENFIENSAIFDCSDRLLESGFRQSLTQDVGVGKGSRAGDT